MFAIIGCGGRDNASDREWRELFKAVQPDLVVVGGARGADSICERQARQAGLKVVVIRADWDRHGKSAGYKRNVEMADYVRNCETVWVCAAKGGKGTAHMIQIGASYGYTIVRI